MEPGRCLERSPRSYRFAGVLLRAPIPRPLGTETSSSACRGEREGL
jgi:hypothetical protein